MTEEQKDCLWWLCENGVKDSVVYDFCEDNGVSAREAFHQIAIWFSPKCCSGCGNVDFYPSMSPCRICCRGKKTTTRMSADHKGCAEGKTTACL